ncbi:hypothetical protein N9112_02325 [bacterium]|nr:hypothetical protein [bacterium]
MSLSTDRQIFTNDHWDEFNEVRPKTPDDGYEIAIRMLRRI